MNSIHFFIHIFHLSPIFVELFTKKTCKNCECIVSYKAVNPKIVHWKGLFYEKPAEKDFVRRLRVLYCWHTAFIFGAFDPHRQPRSEDSGSSQRDPDLPLLPLAGGRQRAVGALPLFQGVLPIFTFRHLTIGISLLPLAPLQHGKILWERADRRPALFDPLLGRFGNRCPHRETLP